MNWIPPSDSLRFLNGLWQPQSVSAVSYPEQGNEVCFQVEDSSYWFEHRNACILSIIQQFPPSGTLYDIGGGNGFVALGLQKAGLDVALLEPGSGARNALKRGVKKVICATLGDAALKPESLMAAGAFDVVEHIEDDEAFLTSIRRLLIRGGRFYCTVPAIKACWSHEDIHAGHYRRYSKQSLTRVIQSAGFEIEFVSSFFSWLTLPVVFLRAFPFWLRGSGADSNFAQHSRDSLESVKTDHRLPAVLSGIARMVHDWETSQLRRSRSIPFGTSLLCVASNR